MTRILLLIPSTSYRAEDFLDAARDFGVDVVVGSDQRPVLEHVAPGRTLWVDMQNPERGAAEAEAFAREYPLDAIVPVDDVGTLLAARAAARRWPRSSSGRPTTNPCASSSVALAMSVVRGTRCPDRRRMWPAGDAMVPVGSLIAIPIRLSPKSMAIQRPIALTLIRPPPFLRRTLHCPWYVPCA